jgi:hypothetical protein
VQPTGGGGGSGCCSQNFKDCITWCGSTQQTCDGCNQAVLWLSDGAPSEICNGRWEACTSNPSICCPGLTCVGDQYYKQCAFESTGNGNPMQPTGSQPTPTEPTGTQLTPIPMQATPTEPTPTREFFGSLYSTDTSLSKLGKLSSFWMCSSTQFPRTYRSMPTQPMVGLQVAVKMSF